MFVESSATPTLVPLPSPINGWAENVALWQDSAVKSAITFGWDSIPQTIRDRFTKPLSGTNKGVRIYVGSNVIHEMDGLNLEKWGGLYVSTILARDPGPRVFVSFSNTVMGSKTLVHEFGHHIDYYYHRLWGSDLADGSSLKLSDIGPLKGLYEEASAAWTAWQAAAPDNDTYKRFSVYGFTNRQEWFAELFAYWLVDTAGYDNYANNGVALLILAGMDIARQQRIYDALKAYLPDMPAMPGL